MQRTYSVYIHILSPCSGVNRSKHFLSDSSHVEYQIKGDGAKSTTQAHILSLHTSSEPGVGSKCQNIFLKVVMLHIKLKEMEHRAPCKHILCPYTYTPSAPVVGTKAKSISFFEKSHVAYQIKGNGA